MQLTVDLVEFLDIDADRDGGISYDELDASIPEVFDAAKRRLQVRGSGAPVTSTLERYDLQHEHLLQMQIVCAFAAPVTRVELTSTMHRELKPDHQHFARVRMHGVERTAVLDRRHETVVFEQDERTWRAAAALGAVLCLLGYLWVRRSSLRLRW